MSSHAPESPPAPARPPAPASSSATHLAARAGALVGALVAVAATFLPWITVPDVLDAAARHTAAGVESREGVVTVVAGVAAVVLVAWGGRARLFWAVVPATLVVLVAGGTLVDCLRPGPDLGGGLLDLLLAGPDAAYGLWMTLAGGVVALGCALLAGRSAPATQPAGDADAWSPTTPPGTPTR